MNKLPIYTDDEDDDDEPLGEEGLGGGDKGPLILYNTRGWGGRGEECTSNQPNHNHLLQ